MTLPISAANQANSSHHHAPPGAAPASPPNKRDLKSWWKGFKLPSKQHETQGTPATGIFGVPLRQSIQYANVAISLIDEKGQSYIYGYVPIVVAKCGVFLKDQATGVEGIFRLSGSEKRIKELKLIFNSPDRYGKGLVWDGYTVHDAANVLRRYLNDLPEPVVPLDLYERFRDPLRGATKQPSGDAEGPQFVDDFDEKAAIKNYQKLITELPPLNRQLLLYILDLLAVFAAKSDENRMTSQNLAAIFQPGMLSHPTHAMAPEEYRLNQCVLIFLIENQDHFLIGMQGTAADENTKKEVESGTPTIQNSKGINRTASNASAGATSVRKEGQIRRNRSVSSKHSMGEGSIGSRSPSQMSMTAGGLGRSNTVPSKKSPALAGSKFRKVDNPGQRSGRLEPMTPVKAHSAAPGPQAPSPVAAETGAAKSNVIAAHVSGPSQERLLEVPQHSTPGPVKERHLQSLFQRSSPEGGEKRQPNKLKKKRIPTGMTISAHSSNTSLPHSKAPSPAFEAANPLEPSHFRSEPIALASANLAGSPGEPASPVPALAAAAGNHTETPLLPRQSSDKSSEPTPRASQIASHSNLHPDDVTKGKKSPPTSVHSSFNDGSDLDQTIDGQTGVQPSDLSDRERKRRWRLSKSIKDDSGGSMGSSSALAPANLWSNAGAETSTTTIASGGSKTRRSLTNDGSESHAFDPVSSYDGDKEGRDDGRGPIGWIKHKYREAKESAEQRRNNPPPADRMPDGQVLGVTRNSHGKSTDAKRQEDDWKDRKPIESALPNTQALALQEETRLQGMLSPSIEPARREAVPEVSKNPTLKKTEPSQPKATADSTTDAHAAEPTTAVEVLAKPAVDGPR